MNKEKEVLALHNQVHSLQNTVLGADGKITLLQFQLQKAKTAASARMISDSSVCTEKARTNITLDR